MCGIFGFVSSEPRPVKDLLIGLEVLEYRGYDSAGLVLVDEQGLVCAPKCSGSVAELTLKTASDCKGLAGFGHTRWATHGAPTTVNAHPHSDCLRNIYVIHNGIIENFEELKKDLLKNGHSFESETDTEVLAHLIEEYYQKVKGGHRLKKAVGAALKKAKGAYAVAVLAADDATTMVTARISSPLAIGVGDKAHYLASDVAAILAHTRKIVYLEDGEIAELRAQEYRVETFAGRKISKKAVKIDWDVAAAQKGGFPHFFLKEVYEQPTALANSLRGRLIAQSGVVNLDALDQLVSKLSKAKKVTFIGCGTAAMAGVYGQQLIERLAGVSSRTVISSEFRYQEPVIQKDEVVIAISQSGETADTLGALEQALKRGATGLSLVNVVGSSVARLAGVGVYNHIGPEISVATTKAFTSQMAILGLIALHLAKLRKVPINRRLDFARALAQIPKQAEKALSALGNIPELAKKYAGIKNALFLGRGGSYPVALEGALKLKEITYIHAEGLPAGELKHGSIAMIDKHLLSVVIMPKDEVYEKSMNAVYEIKARGGLVLVITDKAGLRGVKGVADDVVAVPTTHRLLSPILTVLPLQLFAYFMGRELGVNVDRPRNLAKSVTVE